MKILFAPSETKREGGTTPFKIDSLLFDEALPMRLAIAEQYNRLITSGDRDALSTLFGLKKAEDIAQLQKEIWNEPAMKAIERYSGVAFQSLDYESLQPKAQHYIHTHVLIFSNLFGALKADDLIPHYKLKQGSTVGTIKVEKVYKEKLQGSLDGYLQEEDILDLRAGYYDKFYKPSMAYITLKFIKGGKAISHWAKAYRGIVLREIANAQCETIESFFKLPIEGLDRVEIQTKKNHTEIVYKIN